jgi:hypothetical protein
VTAETSGAALILPCLADTHMAIRTSDQRAFAREVRDVLTAVIGFLHLAELPRYSPDRRSEFAAVARRRAQALRRITRGRLLFVVSRQRPDIDKHLREAFAGDPSVTIVLDRRSVGVSANAAEQSTGSDRRQHDIAQDVANFGVWIGRPEI